MVAWGPEPLIEMVCCAIVTIGGGIETGAIETAEMETGATVAILTGTVATLAVTVLRVPAATAALTICWGVGAWDGGTVFVIVTAGTVTAVTFVRLPDILN